MRLNTLRKFLIKELKMNIKNNLSLKNFMEEYNFRPKKKLGQNFLHDKNIIKFYNIRNLIYRDKLSTIVVDANSAKWDGAKRSIKFLSDKELVKSNFVIRKKSY